MTMKKILLKNQKGTPVASLTLRLGANASVIYPSGFTPVAALSDEKLIPLSTQSDLVLPPQTTAFSLLGKLGSELAFATTLTGEQAAFARWRLLPLVKQEGKGTFPLESPLEQEERGNEKKELGEGGSPSNGQEETKVSPTAHPDLSERFELTPPEETVPLDRFARAEKMIEQGEPFSLFEEWMPNARWAMIQNEECPFLVGIVKDDAGKKVLYGVQGSRDFPPDDGTLWSFFPTSEDGNEGYYLTEEPQHP